MTELSLPPRQFDVPLGRAATRIPGFRAGVDHCRIHARVWDTMLYVETLDDGVALVLMSGEDETSVAFPGHPSLPLSDLVVCVNETGAQPTDIPLDRVPLARPDATKVQGKNKRRRERPITEFVLRPGAPIPKFQSFSPGSQMIEVDLPRGNGRAPEVVVTPSADGQDGILKLDGRVAAVLSGAPDATPDDVRINFIDDADLDRHAQGRVRSEPRPQI